MTVSLPCACTLSATLLLVSPACFALDGSHLKQRADAVLMLMSYTVVPDVTASDLIIGSGSNEKNQLSITQFGGGATLSKRYPIYLEGTLGYSRYDPQFVLSNGDDSRNIPAKWNSLTGTGGIGWDFNLYTDRWGGTLVLRPIFNFMLGTMASDVRIGSRLIEQKRNADFKFLDGGRLNAYGLGGSLMLDYELFSKEQDIDVELRYSGMSLQTFGSTPEAVSGPSTMSWSTAEPAVRYRAFPPRCSSDQSKTQLKYPHQGIFLYLSLDGDNMTLPPSDRVDIIPDRV